MRKAYFVIGPTSTTTRFTSELITEQGINGTFDHVQEFQEMLHPKFNGIAFTNYCLDKVTQLIRCSYPHGLDDPDVGGIVDSLLNAKFDKVFVVVTSRSLPSNIMSNIKRRHIHKPGLTEDEEIEWSYRKIINAISTIWVELNRFKNNDTVKIVPYHVGDLLSNPYLVYRWLMSELDLNPNKYTEDEITNKIKLNIDIKNISNYPLIRE